MNQRPYFWLPGPAYYPRNAPPLWHMYVMYHYPYATDYYGQYGRPVRYPARTAHSRAVTSFLRRSSRASVEPMERQRPSIQLAPVSESQDVGDKKGSGDHEARIREITADMEKASVQQRPETTPLTGRNRSVDIRLADEHQSTPGAAAPVQADVAKQTDQWMYQDKQGRVHGPFSGSKMAAWFVSGNLMVSLPIKRTSDTAFQTLGEVMKTWGRVPFQSDGSEPCDGPSLPPMLPVPLLQRNSWTTSVASSYPAEQPSSTREDIPEPPLKDQPFRHEKNKALDSRLDLQERSMSAASGPASAISASQRTRPALLGVCNFSASIDNDNRKTPVLDTGWEPPDGAYGGYTTAQRQPEASLPSLSTGVDASSSAYSCNSNVTATWGHKRKPLGACTPWNGPEPPAVSKTLSSSGGAYRELPQTKVVPEPPLPWEQRCAADREFTRWTFEALKTLPSYVHAPTFLELLRDVDSEKEIEEYIFVYLGEGDDVKKFAREFIQQRMLWKNLTGWKSSAVVFDDL
ncbi:unnamed protein product [Ixodes hexagonus]